MSETEKVGNTQVPIDPGGTLPDGTAFANDLQEARVINDQIYPTVGAFYSQPLLDMHNRMKEALVLLGRMEEAHVRPPLQKLTGEEIGEIRQRLVQAGLL